MNILINCFSSIKLKDLKSGEKMNVPKLRFKEFNDNYLRLKYKDVLKIKSGKDQKQVECENGIYPILGTGGQIGKTNSFLYDKPSVLIGRKGTINKPQYMETPFWTVDTLFYSHIYEPNIPKYLFYSFQNVNWKKYDESTGVPSLSSSTIESVECNIPSKEEQLKVADFLSLLDKKIELQSKRIEDLKLFKKGLLISKFSNKVKNIKLEEIIKKGKAGGTPKSTVQKYYDGTIPFLSISDISSQNKYIKYTKKCISEDGLKNSSTWLVPKNSIILSMYASYGLPCINKIELATSQAMYNMIFKDDIDVEFIYYYLYYLQQINYYDRLVSTGTQSNLNAEKVNKIKIYCPNYDIQKNISRLFVSCDRKILLEENKLLKLQELKKGLMQSMFV